MTLEYSQKSIGLSQHSDNCILTCIRFESSPIYLFYGIATVIFRAWLSEGVHLRSFLDVQPACQWKNHDEF